MYVMVARACTPPVKAVYVCMSWFQSYACRVRVRVRVRVPKVWMYVCM
jgi:hypothetical protein